MGVLVALVGAALAVPLALRSGPAAHTMSVRGWAYLDQPLTGATVSIRTAGGRTIVRDRTGAIGPSGTLDMTAKVPPSFRVTVAGGQAGEQVFTGQLVADVYSYGPNAPLVQVNPITTLVAAYKDRHGNLSQAAAAAAVGRFLEVPAGVRVTSDLRGNDRWFSPKAFMAEATAAGGVQPFVARLVSEMDARPARTHPFKGAASNDVVKDIGVFVAQKIGNIVLSHALEEIGIGEPTNSEIANSLGEIKQQLTELQISVDEITKNLAKQSFDQWFVPTIPIRSKVTELFSDLEFLATQNAPGGKPDVAKAKDVERQLTLLADENPQTNLDTYLRGGSGTGAYKAWSDLIRSTSPFWTAASYKQLMSLFDYYDVVQLQLIYLLKERASVLKFDPATFQGTDFKRFTDYRTGQLAIRNSVKPVPTPVQLKTNLMWPMDFYLSPVKFDDSARLLASTNSTTCFATQTPGPCVPVGPLYGFTDWRVPSDKEVQGLAPGQLKPRDWLRLQWANGKFFDLCGFGGAESCVVFTNVSVQQTVVVVGEVPVSDCKGDPRTRLHVTFNMLTAKTAKVCDNVLGGVVWPVRVLTPAEKYWL